MIISPGKLKHRTVKDIAPPRPVDLPTIRALTVPLLTPTHLVIDFAVGGTHPIGPASSATGFTVKVAGSSVSQSSNSRTGEDQITIVLALPIAHAAVVTLDYAPGNVVDAASSALASFSGMAVTNLV